MSRKPDTAARRKAKLKAKRVHAEQLRHQQHVRIAAALTDLCADVLPEYIDDSKGPDLVGRNILWRMGMVAWNIAVTGRKEIDDSSVDAMRVDAAFPKGMQAAPRFPRKCGTQSLHAARQEARLGQ